MEGAWNMAVDEAIMESAGADGAPPVLRFYSFNPPTISVGRFQRTEGVFKFDAIEEIGYSFVRRPSGGQAVLHSQELTYCVAIGKHHIAGLGKREVYRMVVPILMAGLSQLGLDTATENNSGRGDPANPDCFASTGEFEIDGSLNRKLIGSAQMVSRTSILQHGSIPLTTANRDIRRFLRIEGGGNHSTSISEELRRTITYAQASKAFAGAAARVVPVIPDVLGKEESARADYLYKTRYLNKSWNMKY